MIESAEARIDCPGCARLSKEIERLREETRELKALLKKSSRNSDQPPSSDPPSIPPRPAKTPTGKKPGGQPGHPGTTRELKRVEDVQRVVSVYPERCMGCRATLERKAGCESSGPLRHQVTEMAPLVAEVTEYQLHETCCERCGTLTRAGLPAGVPSRACGPKIQALAALLTGQYRISRRQVEELLETVFQTTVSLGTVSALEQATSQAIAAPYAEAVAAAQASAHLHVDETGGREANGRSWLWVAVSTLGTLFRLHPKRGREGFEALLGPAFAGIVSSDRWSAYSHLPLDQRAVCWAHLKRDFQKLVDRGGAAAPVGASGLEAVRQLFTLWHGFKDGAFDRAELLVRLQPVQARVDLLLQDGLLADTKTAGFCKNLRKIWPALWTFARVPGVEPTNNDAERALRPAVIWRRTSFGCHSSAGSRFAERILTVVATLRRQGRNVLAFIEEACRAAIAGDPAPELLPAPSG